MFKDNEKAGSLQARAEEIETLLLEKLEQWEMLEGKQNGGNLGFRQPERALGRLPESAASTKHTLPTRNRFETA